jgi:hypothetical protein
VDGIDFFITDGFGEGLYDSCKDVKFGTMNSRALEFIGAGAQNFKGNLILLKSKSSLSLSLSHTHTHTHLHVHMQWF